MESATTEARGAPHRGGRADTPALAYRGYFRAQGVKALKRNILGFVGFAPVREMLVGAVDHLGDAGVSRWQARLHRLGRAAA